MADVLALLTALPTVAVSAAEILRESLTVDRPGAAGIQARQRECGAVGNERRPGIGGRQLAAGDGGADGQRTGNARRAKRSCR